MTRKNLTRNALFTSIISLLLCVSMLVGTTFAWFTDSVTSGVNTIASGNLDVELYHGKDANPVDKVKSDTLLFTDVGGNVIDLWEPGVVAFTNLKVANEGTLALKYQLSINSTEMNTVKDTELTLADALKVAVVEGGVSGTREQVIGAVADNAWTKLESFTLPGVLEADKKSETYGIVIYWQPGDNAVDNQFNMNNGKTTSNGEPLTITLGVNLFATQEMYEDDSFGPDYDGLVWDKAQKVMSEAELIAALENGVTEIMLEDNIALTNALEIPAGTELALNLNGKSLTGTGLDADGKGTAVIVNEGNLKLVNGNVKATGENGGATINNKGTLTLDDVAVIGAPISSTDSGYPGYCINSSGNLTIENGTTVSADRGCLYLSGTGSTVINGGSFTNNDISDKRAAFTSHVVVVAYGANNKLTINGGTFKHLHTKTSGGVVINNWSAVTVDVNGGNFSGGNYFGKWDNLSDYGYGSTKTPFAVRGGTFTGMDEKFIAAGYKAVESNGKYIVVSENAIATSDDLIAAINAANDGDTLLLAPGEYSLRFTNDTAFNVDNLNIKGMDNAKLTVSSSEAWYGRVQGDNVTFENIHFTSSVGATGKATYNNCTFDDWAICASSGNKETYFNNCDINGTLNTSTDFSSGNTYVTDSTVAKAEFAGAATMYFTNCKIGELISWDMATVLKNCDVEKQDMKMKDQKVTTIETDKNGLSLATNNADPDALVLYEVPSDYAKTTLAVPEGVTAIGNYAFAYNSKVETVNLPTTVTDLGRGFDSSTVKKVVLNEGLETISPRAFKSTTALEEVVISSSVKTIDDDAFQKTGLKTITIPATVEYVGAQAFGASKIETVIFEGDITIQNKAFRGCANLRTVYINGDDITFENTTGEANCWFCNSESSNPNTSEITFHVKNESVAAKVKAAMGKDIEKVVILVNDVPYEG